MEVGCQSLAEVVVQLNLAGHHAGMTNPRSLHLLRTRSYVECVIAAAGQGSYQAAGLCSYPAATTGD